MKKWRGEEGDPTEKMKIECFFSQGCSSNEILKPLIEKVLAEEGVQAEVIYRIVSQEEAEKLGIGGSPTVWINGQDLEPGTPPGGIS